MANTDLSDDDISITSTAPSEYQEEYEVEDVLAENKPDDGSNSVYYLVKWANYPLERCTWEPEESFCDEQTLRDWRTKKEAIAQNKATPFDVDALMERINALEEARALRKSKRRAKRIRLGIPVSSSDSEESENSLDDFIVNDDEEDASKRRKVQGNSKRRFSQIDGGSRSPNSLFDEVIDITASPKRAGSSSLSHTKKKRQLEAPGASLRQQPSVNDRGATSFSRPSRPNLSLQPPISRFASSAIPAFQDRSSAMGPCSAPAPKTRRQGTGTGADDPRAYRLLSTQRRQEKFNRRDREPDITQLELRRPSDWLNQPPAQVPAPSGAARRIEDTGSLFVEQANPVLQHSPLCTSDLPRETIRPGDGSVNGQPQEPNEPIDRPQPISNPISQPYRRCNPGDILVTLKINGMEGDAIIRTDGGVRGLVKKQLLDLSVRRRLLMDFQETCTVDEYKKRCEKGYNIEHYHCWAIGFEDTTNTLNEMVKYLRAYNLAAVWHHPHEETQLVLVAYATGSPNWDVLHEEYTIPPEHGLRIVIRGTLPPLGHRLSRRLVKSPQQLHSQQPHREANQHTQRPLIRHAVPAGPLDLENSDSAMGLLTPPPQAQPIPDIQTDFKALLASYRKEHQLTKIFKEVLGINFKDLCTVRTKKGSENVKAFYLWFPAESSSVRDEFDLVKSFLQENKVTVFSEDWDGFSSLVKRQKIPATVLFHQAFFNYEDVSDLANILLQPYINIFNISLRGPVDDALNCHLQQLFPCGGVILMTEDFITRETSNALTVIEWFRGMSTQSTHWKIFFRPNVQQWLFDLFDTWKDEKIFKIYCRVKQLIPEYPASHFNYGKRQGSPEELDGLTDDEGQHHPFISPSSLPNYNSRRQDEHDAIPKGVSQEQRDADQLIEHFALWTLNNCHKYRKFFVLTHFKSQPRWGKWHHITILRGNEFIKTLNLLPRQSRNSSTTSRNDPKRRTGHLNTTAQASSSQIPSIVNPAHAASPSTNNQPDVKSPLTTQNQRIPTSPKDHRPSLDPRVRRHSPSTANPSTAHHQPPNLSSDTMPPPHHPLPSRSPPSSNSSFPPQPSLVHESGKSKGKWIRGSKRNWVETYRLS